MEDYVCSYELLIMRKGRNPDSLGQYTQHEFERFVKDYRHYYNFAKKKHLPRPTPVKIFM